MAAAVMVKAPIADTASFGTGEWDAGASLSVAPQLGDRVLALLEMAAWHMGDLGSLNFQDPIYVSAGLSYFWSPGWLSGVSATVGTTAMDGYEGPAWIGAHLTRSSGGAAWGFSGSIGLSETTPDLTLGLFWRVRLFGAS